MTRAEPLPCTPAGNAQRFVEMFGDSVRWGPGYWLVRTHQDWDRDTSDLVRVMAQEVVLAIRAEAGRTDDPVRRTELLRWAMRSGTRTRMETLLRLARDHPALRHSSRPHDVG